MMRPNKFNLLIVFIFLSGFGCPSAQRAITGTPPAGQTASGGSGGGIGAGASATGEPSGGATGAGGAATDEGGAEDAGDLGPGIVAEAPPTVPGSPMPSMPRPRCWPKDARLYFKDSEMALTGRRDKEERRELFVRAFVYSELPPDEAGLIGKSEVHVDDLSGPLAKRILTDKTNSGCFFVKIYAPERAVGQTVRVTAQVAPVCDSGNSIHEGGHAMMMKADGAQNLEATLDVILPRETELSNVDPCPSPQNAWPPKGHLYRY